MSRRTRAQRARTAAIVAADPHKDEATTAADAAAQLRTAIAGGSYVIRAGEPRACKGCGEVRELRFGYCFPCAEPYLDPS